MGVSKLSGTESIPSLFNSKAISTRCFAVSLSPKIPPLQTLNPAF